MEPHDWLLSVLWCLCSLVLVEPLQVFHEVDMCIQTNISPFTIEEFPKLNFGENLCNQSEHGFSSLRENRCPLVVWAQS